MRDIIAQDRLYKKNRTELGRIAPTLDLLLPPIPLAQTLRKSYRNHDVNLTLRSTKKHTIS